MHINIIKENIHIQNGEKTPKQKHIYLHTHMTITMHENMIRISIYEIRYNSGNIYYTLDILIQFT